MDYGAKNNNNNDLTTAEVSKETATERQMKQLEMASEGVFKLAESLERRLAPLLQSQPKSEGAGTPHEQMPAHPESIRVNVERLNSAAYILQSVLSRLEI